MKAMPIDIVDQAGKSVRYPNVQTSLSIHKKEQFFNTSLLSEVRQDARYWMLDIIEYPETSIQEWPTLARVFETG